MVNSSAIAFYLATTAVDPMVTFVGFKMCWRLGVGPSLALEEKTRVKLI